MVGGGGAIGGSGAALAMGAAQFVSWMERVLAGMGASVISAGDGGGPMFHAEANHSFEKPGRHPGRLLDLIITH